MNGENWKVGVVSKKYHAILDNKHHNEFLILIAKAIEQIEKETGSEEE